MYCIRDIYLYFRYTYLYIYLIYFVYSKKYIYTYDIQGADRNSPEKLAVELPDFYYVYH